MALQTDAPYLPPGNTCISWSLTKTGTANGDGQIAFLIPSDNFILLLHPHRCWKMIGHVGIQTFLRRLPTGAHRRPQSRWIIIRLGQGEPPPISRARSRPFLKFLPRFLHARIVLGQQSQFNLLQITMLRSRFGGVSPSRITLVVSYVVRIVAGVAEGGISLAQFNGGLRSRTRMSELMRQIRILLGNAQFRRGTGQLLESGIIVGTVKYSATKFVVFFRAELVL
mmetsp:Transcript_14514/g.23049  ORF Transcript_14514/g.23049 Transcript_14514/m.23049 type:complete len:225 (-) Transcript_14514:23-697(-)